MAFVSVLVYITHGLTNIRLGTQLMKALERAVKGAKLHRKEADSITTAWAQFVPGWRKMLLNYKRNKKCPNPFEEPDPGWSTHMRMCSKLNDLRR